MHWTEGYVAAPQRDEDCADFVVRVQAEQFGRRIVLPQHAATVRGRDRQIAALAGVAWERVEQPADGDLALMRSAGRRRCVGHHLGVWCQVAGAPCVLHRLEVGVVLHGVGQLAGRGLELTEVCRWAA